MTISHSCCPNKTDICPPEFERAATILLPKGIMQEWVCSGCRTVIYVFEEATPLQTVDAAGIPNILLGGN